MSPPLTELFVLPMCTTVPAQASRLEPLQCKAGRCTRHIYSPLSAWVPKEMTRANGKKRLGACTQPITRTEIGARNRLDLDVTQTAGL